VHQGNGVATVFLDDPSVKIFDMFGGHLGYPQDPVARERIDHPIVLSAGLAGPRYIGILQSELKAFVAKYSDVGLCIYNAGTDIFEGDPLGQLKVAETSVLLRDRCVFGVMAEHHIPCAMVPSGGYTDDSHRLIANTVCALVREAQI
jgi:histone deacetylase 11